MLRFEYERHLPASSLSRGVQADPNFQVKSTVLSRLVSNPVQPRPLTEPN